MTMRGWGMRGGLAVVTVACLTGLGQAKPSDKGKPDRAEATKAEADKTVPPLTRDAVNAAAFAPADKPDAATTKVAKAKAKASQKRPQALLMKVQVLLDRAHFSPGAIDGLDGENMQGALSAFAVAQGLPATKTPNQEVFDKLQATSPEPVAVEYTITDADVAGPFVETMPAKMEEQAALESMGYTNVREMLAERFHMARDLLTALNPDTPLDRAGTVITVAGVPALETGKPKVEAKAEAKTDAKADTSKSDRTEARAGERTEPKAETKPDAKAGKDVARIEIDKATRQLRAFDKADRLVAFYPASIGSEEKPAPSGEAKVKGVAFDPSYTYNPKYSFKGVKAKSKFSIHPGPNNPVGLVWIDLSIPSYGIHGTPEPEKVGKTESHGCIRLTNWDARDLAARVERGATVAFKDD